MSGGDQKLNLTPLWDSGPVTNGAAISITVAVGYVQSIYAFLDNQSNTTTRVVTATRIRSDGGDTATPQTTSVPANSGGVVIVSLSNYIGSGYRFSVAAAGSDPARLVLRAVTPN